MIANKQDFVEVNFTGKIKESNIVFDTNNEKTAKENGIYQEGQEYKPITVCLGEGLMLKSLELKMIGLEIGKKHIIEITPEDAFGKKNPKLLKIVNTNTFRKQKVNPQPGLQVNIDGMTGLIKTVSGGRTIVDFNHPLSGRDLIYEIEMVKKLETVEDKIKGLSHSLTGFDFKVEFKEGKAKISFKDKLPEEVTTKLSENFKRLIPEVKEIEYSFEK